MYQEYFKLRARPFTNYPGHQYFDAGKGGAEKLAQIQRIATARDGMAVITGGPGVGKSALVEHALFPISNQIAIARADMREVPPAELYRVLLASLDEPSSEGGPEQHFVSLQEVIRQYHKNDMQVTALIDVNGLGPDTVAPISRLVHLAGAPDGQLNIMLQGPHTLHKFLDLPALMHLRQRVSYRYCVRPLTYADTDTYIRHQLKAVGGDTQNLLADDVSAVVFQYVAGVPRLINTMMDAILGELFSARIDRATADHAEKVAQHLGWRPLTTRPAAASKPDEMALSSLLEETRNAVNAVAPAAPEPQAAPDRLEPGPVEPLKPAKKEVPVVVNVPRAERKLGEDEYSAIPAMDPNDPGATGMLRLDEIDERFAETIFTDDPDFFKADPEEGEESGEIGLT